MTAMLASVRNLAEAELAVAAGVDWLDLKDPTHGALGAVEPTDVAEVVARFRGRLPISATIGDCWETPDLIASRVRALAALHVDYVKIGLYLSAWSNELATAFVAAQAAMPHLIAVCFAESPTYFSRLAALPVCGAMLDTANKTQGSLLTQMTGVEIAEFLHAARESRLMTGVAGSLGAGDIPLLLPRAPDYLGFRGALCHRRDRVDALDSVALAEIRRLIPPPIARRRDLKGAVHGLA